MKYIFSFSFTLFLLISGYSQISTFNKRFDFDMRACVLTSIVATDSCYYSTGVISDSIPTNRTGVCFAKFDLDGNLIYMKSIADSNKSYNFWSPNLKNTYDGNFVVAGYQVIPSVNMLALLIKYEPNGDTLFVKVYDEPFEYEENDFYKTEEVALSNDGGFLLGGSSNVSIGDADIVLTKLDSLGNLEYIQTDRTVYKQGIVTKIIPTSDGGYLLGGRLDNFLTTMIDYESQIYLIKMDSLGGIEWKYLSPIDQFLGGVSDMVLEDDGSIVIATMDGIEIPINVGNAGTIQLQPYMIKLDSNREVVWETIIREFDWAGSNRIRKMLRLSDDSGYIMVGNALVGQDTFPGIASGNFWGSMAKVSPDGDSLWHRHHYLIVDPHETHDFYDIKETHDGGLIMCGESFRYNEHPELETWQQGWIIKTDQHGCLVPGCHILSSQENLPDKIALQMYPNPTSDFLNIFFKTERLSKNGIFRVIDLNGRVVKTFTPASKEGTYMLPVQNYSVGMYFLQYMEDGVSRYSEQFVVEK